MIPGGTAATAVSISEADTQMTLAYEVFTAAFGAGDDTVTITPTKIKEILMVQVTPTNAAAAAADVPYISAWVPGGLTCEITGANSGNLLILVVGKVA